MPEDPVETSDPNGSAARYSLLAAAALCLPLLALAVSASVFPTSISFRVFSVAALFAIQFIVVVYLISGPAALGLAVEGTDEAANKSVFDPETEERLRVLEEAGRLLGGSLRLKDMFRLITSKTGDIVPLKDVVLLIADPDTRDYRLIGLGPSPESVPDKVRELASVAEGKRSSVILSAADSGKTVRWAAIPLSDSGEVFAVIAGKLAEGSRDDRELRILLDAIAERISPVISAALSFDEKEANALVDVLTGLPNGRAFELVLANRVAEAQRARGGARLMVLAIDVKDFSAINSRFGHDTGDRVLHFAGEVIRDQLRKMDLVARTSADEFLAVLPAAGPETAEAVVGRIRSEFRSRKFELPSGESAVIEINLGSAVYGSEAAGVLELIASARDDRDGAKPGKSNQVIRFPTKHSN